LQADGEGRTEAGGVGVKEDRGAGGGGGREERRREEVAVAAAEAGRRQPCGGRSKSHGLRWREQMADPSPLCRAPSTGKRRAGGDGGARRQRRSQELLTPRAKIYGSKISIKIPQF
jgi:hypothetical protein